MIVAAISVSTITVGQISMGYVVLTFFILSFMRPSVQVLQDADDLNPLEEENRETGLLVSYQEESKEAMPVATSINEGNENGQDASGVEISHGSSKFWSEKLAEFHDLAKNISYSKGIYREPDNQTSDELEIRRSLLKKVAVVSESDIMRGIVETLNIAGNQVQLLEQLEDLVHQYDVAVNFASLGGIKIVAPLLFSTDDKIASSAALVLGSAMQSNPAVQKIAVNYGVVKNLVDLLEHKSPSVLPKVIFALASLLRNSPKAQEEFIVINGVYKLVEILKKNHNVTTNTKLKIINLFGDLVTEQIFAFELDSSISGRNFEEIESLQRSFEREIMKFKVCQLIPPFLDFEDFDTHQKTVEAMISLYGYCFEDFQDAKIIYRLKFLKRLYDARYYYEFDAIYPLIDDELTNDLYDDLDSLISFMMEETLSKANKSMLKDEL